MNYSLTRATTWNLAGYLYLIVASLISTPILIHNLGLTAFAQYSLVVVTLALVSSFNLGLPQAVIRALVRGKTPTLWATSLILFISTGFVAGLVATTLAFILGLPPISLPIIFALSVLTHLVAHYTTLPQALGHFGYFNAKTFIVGTANTLLAAYLAWAGQGIVMILTAQLLCYLLTLLPLVYFSLKFFPQPWLNRPSRPVAQSLIHFGLKNQLGTLVGQIQSQYAKYLLAALSPLTLSAYVIAGGLVQKLAGGVSQLASALYPLSAGSSPRDLRPLYWRLQMFLFFFGILVVWLYGLFGLSFLSWWLHSPELVAVVHSVLQILVWYFAALVLTPLASTILDARGRPELTSFFAFITAAIEIVLAFILYPTYGLFAPVYASLIAILLTTPVLLVATDRVLKSSI